MSRAERARIIRRRRAIRNRRIAILGIMIFMSATVSILFHNFGARAEKADTTYKYYTDIRVHRGDTLWSLAMEYMTEEYSSPEEYIREVRQINDLGAELPYGKIIVLPYYSSELK